MAAFIYLTAGVVLFVLSILGRFERMASLPLIAGLSWAAIGIVWLVIRWRAHPRRTVALLVAGAAIAASAHFGQTAYIRAKHGRWEREALAALERTGAPPLAFAHVVNGDWNGQYRGITVLNFWATWCSPCLKELPLLEAFSKSHDPSLVRVVGFTRFYEASRETELASIEEVLKRSGVTYPSLVAADANTHDAFHAQGIPTTVLIDANGKVAAWGIGERGAKRVMQLADQLASKR